MLILFYSSVRVAKWPPFGKELHTRLTICSLCILTVILVNSRFGLGSDCSSTISLYTCCFS